MTPKRNTRRATRTTVHVAIVLDESGSMAGQRATDAIKAYNDYLDSLAADKNKYNITLIKFHSDMNSRHIQTVYSDVPVDKAPRLNSFNYKPNGGTPLYDAVGSAITEMAPFKKNVFIAILTDGEENTSYKFTAFGLADLIAQKEADGWTFVYLGASKDGWAQAVNMGIRPDNAVVVNYNDTQKFMRGFADSTVRYAASASMGNSASYTLNSTMGNIAVFTTNTIDSTTTKTDNKVSDSRKRGGKK